MARLEDSSPRVISCTGAGPGPMERRGFDLGFFWLVDGVSSKQEVQAQVVKLDLFHMVACLLNSAMVRPEHPL